MVFAKAALAMTLFIGAARAAPNVEEAGRAFSGYSSGFPSLEVSPDGRRVVTGDEDGNVVVWDIAEGKPSLKMRGHKGRIFSAAFSPDGAAVLSAGKDGTLRLWNASSGALIRKIDGGGGEIFAAAFSPDGREALTGDQAGGVKLWDLSSGRLRRAFSGTKAPVAAAAFTGDGKLAITTDVDNKVNVWDIAAGKALKTLQEPGHFIVGRFIARDQRSFLFGGGSLNLVDIGSGEVLRTFPQTMPGDSARSAAAFSPDGRYFIVEAEHHRLNLWETGTGRLVRTYSAPLTLMAAVFTPDGTKLIASFGSLSKTGKIVVWPVDCTEAPGKAAAAKDADPSAAALGKLLFFDPRLSHDRTISCASCHDPKKGWTDRLPVSIGIGGRRGRRNTMTVLNSALHTPLFWDGRAVSLEDQVRFPLSHPGEMGASPEQAAKNIAAVPGYHPFFKAAFNDEEVTPRRIAQALAAFERTLISMDSPYDAYAAGDPKALSPEALRGLGLFRTKARCFMCHELSPSRNPEFINIGLKASDDPGDLGRYEVSKNDKDRGAFIVPDLHNIGRTPPYMHDGSLKTLADVVEFYDKGGEANPRRFEWLKPAELTVKEKADLVTLLNALDGDPRELEPPKTLP